MIDPAVSVRDRDLLLGDPEQLHPPGALPRRRWFGGRTWQDTATCLAHAPVWTLLPGFIGWFFGGRVRLAALAAQAVVAGLAVASALGPGLFFFISASAMPIVFAVLLALCGDGPAARLARSLHGRYIRPQDLSHPEARLLTRAQLAATAVVESNVNQAGLLDDVRNAVTLPDQVWEIAQTLKQINALRLEHEAQPDPADPRIT